MNDQEKQEADRLLARIETASGEIPERAGPNGQLIAEILRCVHGLRSLLGVVRTH